MSRQLISWSGIALLTFSVVTKTPAAAPPAEYKLMREDRRFLHGMLKEFLFDPTAAQWVAVTVIPGNFVRLGWLKSVNADRTAAVYFTDGVSISTPVQLVTPIDFVASCKELLRPTDNGPQQQRINPEEIIGGRFFVPQLVRVDGSNLILAAWLYRLGHESLAARTLARVSDRRKVLTALRLELAWSAFAGLGYAFSKRADDEALGHGERLLRLYSNEAAEKFPQGKALVEDLKRRKKKGTFGRNPEKLPDGFDRWEFKKKIIHLIDALEEWDEREWGKSDPRVKALIAIGEPAIPALIDVIEKDKRLTRHVHQWKAFSRHYTVLPVCVPALNAVESILRLEMLRTHFTAANFLRGSEEAAREVARQLRAYWKTYRYLPFY